MEDSPEPGQLERLELLSANEELRLLNQSYSDYIDSGRLAEFAQLFAQGTWKGIDGAPAVQGWLERHVILYDGTPRTHHLLSGMRFVVDGATATGSSTATVFQEHPASGQIVVIIVADYADEYARGPQGEWYFVSRVVHRRLEADVSTHLRLPARSAKADAQAGLELQT